MADEDPDDPDENWSNAPFIVASNRERFNISYKKSLEYARKHGMHLIRWPCQMEESTWDGKPEKQEHREEAVDRDPTFWQWFVPGIHVYLNQNVNVGLGMANGTRCKLHSLSFSDERTLRNVRRQTLQTPLDKVITLKEPPVSVNVQLTPAPLPKFHSPRMKRVYIEKIAALKSLSLSDKEFIIPITAKTSTKTKRYTISGNGNKYKPSKANVRPIFAYDNEFAMTVHKSQGRTMKKVILALCERTNPQLQMTLASIFVAFSRVKCRDDIRLLLHDSTTANKISYDSLKYITKLKLPPPIKAFHAGFPNNCGVCQLDKALESYFQQMVG